MYKFIDTTEVSEGIILPSEALQINGEYIEDLIPGYRTLNVKGREALSPDVTTYETGVRDGSILKGKRYPARIITVYYQLMAESNEAFREAYNQLGKILNVTNAKLIFNDEQDKYYTGTPCIIGEVPPGKNAVTGNFEIICTDPFKYSTIEYEATVADGEKDVTFDYKGTYKSFPVLETAFFDEREVADDGETSTALTGAGDCGYVAFFNEDEKIIQLGDPDEIDKEEGFAKSQTMMNQTFLSETAWGTTAKELWAVNKGHIMASNVTQEGSVAMGYASYETGTTSSSVYTSGTIGSFYSGGENVGKATFSTRRSSASSVSVTISASLTINKIYGKYATLNFTVALTNGVTFSGQITRAVTVVAGKTYSSSITKTITLNSANATNIGVSYFSISGGTGYGGTTSACNSISVKKYTTSQYTYGASYFLNATDYGKTKSGWHGPTITRQITADETGEVGASHFSLTYKQKFCISSGGGSDQVGSFRMNIVNSAGANIAGVWVYKNKSGKAGNLVFFVNGKQVNETPIDLHYNNIYFGLSEDAAETTTVTKSGGTITFAIGSYKRTFTEAALENVKATAVTFSFEKYGELTPMQFNGLYWAKFVKDNCSTWKNIPNKFSANDVLEADCKTGEIYLNGVASPDLGALGNNWEGFFLTPGINSIGVACSEWVPAEYMPTFKVRYREVFL